MLGKNQLTHDGMYIASLKHNPLDLSEILVTVRVSNENTTSLLGSAGSLKKGMSEFSL